MTDCAHARLTIEVCDQTLGLVCRECETLVAFCWMDDHIPESLWNRACTTDPNGKPCEQNRDDVCALCGDSVVGDDQTQV